MHESNAEILPVDKQKMKGYIKHVQVVLPALDAQWVIQKQFLYYIFPPTRLTNGNYVPGVKEIWLETMSYVLDDIWWLCELKYHEFWSRIIFDSGAINGIRSFLQLAPFQKLYFKIDDAEITSMYKRIKRAAFQFMKRIFRLKESDLHFMTEEKYIEILTTNRIPSMSWLFSLSTLYGRSDQKIIHSMISHALKYNKNLCLDNAITGTIQLFSSLKKKLRKSEHELKINLKNSDNAEDVVESACAYRQCLHSSVQFLSNSIRNIHCFLNVYKEGYNVFLNHDFDFHILRVYKKLIRTVYHEIAVIFDDDRYRRSYLKLELLLSHTRIDFVAIFYECLEAMMNKLNVTTTAKDVIDRYGKLLKMASKSDEFLIDFNRHTKFNEFHESFMKKCPNNIDLSELNSAYETLLKTLSEIVDYNNEACKQFTIDDNEPFDYDFEDNEGKEECVDDDTLEGSDEFSSNYSDWNKTENTDSEHEGYFEKDNENESSSNSPHESLECSFSQTSMNENPVASTFPVDITEIGLQIAISEVKDLLPHLGNGFIAMCLYHIKMDVTVVINALLENNLPTFLQEVDFSLSTIPKYILEKLNDEGNGYMNSNEIMEPRLKELRKSEYSSYKELLNDRADVNEVKSIYEKYRNVEDQIYNDDVEEDYENDFVHVIEADPEGFSTEYTHLPKENPNYATCESDEQSESEDQRPESSLTETSSTSRGRYQIPLDFCENPELTRAKIAQRYRANQERRYRGRAFHNRNSDENEDNVKEKNDRRHRHLKNVNKVTSANHSRKFFSTRKRRE